MIKFTNNKRFFLNIFAVSLSIFGISMIPTICVASYSDEAEIFQEFVTFAIFCFVTGEIIHRIVHRDVNPVKPRAWYITVLFTWFFFIFLSSLTFLFSVDNISVIDSIFEATASLTGTGTSSIDVPSLPYSLKLWRSTLNWIGSIGLIVTTMSILRTWQFLGRGITLTEIPGPTFLKSNTIFYKSYRYIVPLFIVLTLIEIILLTVSGMPISDSVLTAMSNISTSGLLHFENNDVSGMSIAVKVIITIFAVLGSIDFNIFFFAIRKRFRMILRHSELKFYAWRVLTTSAVITIALVILIPGVNIFNAIANSLIQSVSYISTSGYEIAGSSAWPEVCKIVIVLQMAIGASAVSTGGGIKMSRIIIMFKTVSFSIFRHIHPRSVRSLMYNREPLKSDQVVRANIYVSLFFTVFLLGMLCLSMENISLLDAMNYSLTMLSNTGSSISEIAKPVAEFSIWGKSIMCLLMLAGRLEIYPLIMLFMPSLWASDNTK